MSVEECYKNLNKHTLTRQFITQYKGIPLLNEKNLTAVTDITFTLTETGDYVIGTTMSERGFVYLSKEPLTGDFETDKSNLVEKSEPIHLIAGQKMYMRLIVNNADDPSVCVPGQVLCRAETGETVSIIKVENVDKGFNNNDVLTDDWFRIGQQRDFRPSLIDFKNNGVYRGETINDQDIDYYVLNAFKFTSRSYRRRLYVSPLFYNRPNIRIEVDSGEFRLTGFIVGSENESFIINNGPLPTRTPSAYETYGPDDDGESKGKSKVVIIAVVIVVAVVVIAVIVIGVIIYKKKKTNKDSLAVFMDSGVTNESFNLS